jgi:hypothetical protein
VTGALIFGPWWANEQDDCWTVHASDDAAPIMGNRVCTFPLTEQGAERALLTAAAPDLYDALKLAKSHIEHMAAWISRRPDGYSFEAIGEDMPSITGALAKAAGQ